MANRHISEEHDRLLTEVELELMTVIWSLEKATVKEVISHMSKDRSLAYTTVATVMKILEQKGFLTCHKDSHAHTFSPAVSKKSYESTCLDHVVTNVFDGEPVALVQRLLDVRKLSKSEIEAIKKSLQKLSASEKGRK